MPIVCTLARFIIKCVIFFALALLLQYLFIIIVPTKTDTNGTQAKEQHHTQSSS